MKLRPYKNDESENNIFWVTISDLMTALVLVFMMLFFYTYMQGYYERLHANIEKQKASEALEQSLQAQNINANIDAVSGIVKISDLELFELNSWELSENGKRYLNKFAPAYLNSLFSNEYMDKNVEKIIIEGHTDSQTFQGKYSADEQYMKNMDLSLKRAYSVANYMMGTSYNKSYSERLKKMILVEGASFSNPVLTNGKEDFAKSRRVELKLVFSTKDKEK